MERAAAAGGVYADAGQGIPWHCVNASLRRWQAVHVICKIAF